MLIFTIIIFGLAVVRDASKSFKDEITIAGVVFIATELTAYIWFLGQFVKVK